MNNTLKIGLFGLGTVGSGLMDVLPGSGLDASVQRICVKTPGKPRKFSPEKITLDPDEILEDPSIQVVVETTTAVKEAFEIVQKALLNGKHVVTANKKMVAHYFPQLFELQNETGKTLLYESAACGAIPIVRTLDEHFGNEPLESLSGIFNGTSNYILTRMLRENLDFDSALAAAQANGFAELDPSSDVDGFDAKYKLILLAAHSFGHVASPESVLNLGIRFIRREDLNFAQQRGKTIKLLPMCKPTGEHQFSLYVLPALVAGDDVLSQVHEEYNGVKVHGRYSGQQFFKGRGAGSHPTGSALLADLAALKRGFSYQYQKYRQNGHAQLIDQTKMSVYCSFPTGTDPHPLGLQQVEAVWANQQAFALNGKINVKQLKKMASWIHKNSVFLAVNP